MAEMHSDKKKVVAWGKERLDPQRKRTFALKIPPGLESSGTSPHLAL